MRITFAGSSPASCRGPIEAREFDAMMDQQTASSPASCRGPIEAHLYHLLYHYSMTTSSPASCRGPIEAYEHLQSFSFSEQVFPGILPGPH